MKNKIKILVVGEAGVGKSKLGYRYKHGEFQLLDMNTVGVQSFKVERSHRGKQFEFIYYDTCGDEKYRSIAAVFFRQAQGVIFVFDLKDQESLGKLDYWFTFVNEKFTPGSLEFLLLGNKNDLEGPSIEPELIAAVAEREQVPYFQTSALTGHNVHQAFTELQGRIMRRGQRQEAKTSYKLSLVDRRGERPGCCW